ncbi:MAG: ribonuclease HII [Thermoplasmata archaeon]
MARICGVDEAGRGPVIGPLVVAGVLVEDDAHLREMRVKDSKKLSVTRREELSEEILKTAECDIQVVPAEDIDETRKLMTINEFEAKLFASVLEKLRPDVAYLDSADANCRTFESLVRKELAFDLEIICEHKADELFPVVSAASIIAKERREEEVRRIGKELGEDIGSGYPADPITVEFLQRWISEKGDLPPNTRRSWETARRMLSESKLRKLDEYQ